MIVLYNPISTTPGKQPLPLSLMSLAAVLESPPGGVDGTDFKRRHQWCLVDGNVVADPAADIIGRLTGVARAQTPLLAVTVMPGPQLTQAVAVCKAVKAALPHVPIVWGGYFPTQHTETVLRAAYVDFVVRSQGEHALLQLVAVLRTGGLLNTVGGLSWKTGRRARDDGKGDVEIVNNPIQPLTALDDLPDLPYHRVNMERYIQPNYLGRRTVAHNSSFGCPFACSFCAVVAMSNRRWIAQSPARIERALRHLSAMYRIDAVQMHDMDFFISEPRTADFATRISDLGLHWWGLGRVDLLMQYSDATWQAMARSGLKMIFSGAETGTDAALERMNKGGNSSAALTLELARRMHHHRIIPEFSFVLGCPPDPEQDIAATFEFIRRIKQINPATEIILYSYTPVPLDGTLYTEAQRQGFAFPQSLDEWATPEWEQLSMRRGDNIPWLGAAHGAIRRRVRDFERVINAFYPTATDRRLTRWRRATLRAVSSWRYALRCYDRPYELRALNRLISYQRPETTGF